MSNRKYFELIALYYRTYFSSLNQGMESNQANNLDNFWFFPEEENRLWNLISLIQCLHINFSIGENINAKSIELWNKQVKKVTKEDMEKYLSTEEIEHLLDSIYDVDSRIKELS